MAPTPREPDEDRELPKLHLRVYDLSEDGASKFFANTVHSTPYNLIKSSCQQVLKQLYPKDPKWGNTARPHGPPIRSITLNIRSMDGVAYTTGSILDEQHKEIHFSTSYIAQLSDTSDHPQRIKDEIEGVLVHELVHVFQYDANGSMPGGVVEGVADWVRLKAHLEPPHWKRGEGAKWDDGYQTTAYFLEYLEEKFKNPLLVPELNSACRKSKWNDGMVLKELCKGNDVEGLWKEYKNQFEKKEDDADDGQPAKPVPTHLPKPV